MENSEEITRYKKAQAQVKLLKGFYIHLIIFVLFLTIIIFINLKFTPEQYWFIYPTLGGGIGITFHALGTFNQNSVFSKGWEEKKLKQFIKEEQNNHKSLK